MKKITVLLPYIKEEIHIDKNIINFILDKIKRQKYDKIILILDSGVFKTNNELVNQLLFLNNIVHQIILHPIPKYKNYNEVSFLIKDMVANHLTRKSCLVAAGGGYVADITGFAASIYMRRIDFIQIPTTFMAMGDAVIGKVAVNYGGHKNIVGNFYSPRFVFVDTSFLKTVNNKEIVYGLVEIWKHGIIAHNNKYIKQIESYLCNSIPFEVENIIFFSLKTKAHYVLQDYDDRNGYHKALSLGHTFANYFERKFKLRHGAAVFYGILIATILALNLEIISEQRKNSILYTAIFFEKHIGLMKKLQSKITIANLLAKIKFDKINTGSGYTFVLPTEKGYKVESDISAEVLRRAVKDFKRLKGL